MLPKRGASDKAAAQEIGGADKQDRQDRSDRAFVLLFSGSAPAIQGNEAGIRLTFHAERVGWRWSEKDWKISHSEF
jgi:hypothetical protein